jgi:hypothetical protein
MAWGRFPLVAYISITGPLVLIGLLFYLHSGRFTVTPTSSVP